MNCHRCSLPVRKPSAQTVRLWQKQTYTAKHALIRVHTSWQLISKVCRTNTHSKNKLPLWDTVFLDNCVDKHTLTYKHTYYRPICKKLSVHAKHTFLQYWRHRQPYPLNIENLTAETNLANCLNLDFGIVIILNLPRACFELKRLPKISHVIVRKIESTK